MSETPLDPSRIEALVKAVRQRVPVDAAALLAKESYETVDAVLSALPQGLAQRIAAELPEGVRPRLELVELNVPVPGLVSELTDPPRGVITTGTTVAQAIEFLRSAESVTDITYLYIVDSAQKLIGLVVMRDMILARPSQSVDEIMIAQPFAFPQDMKILDAIQASIRRQYPVYPVVDTTGKLVGTVRGWKLSERQVIEVSAQAGRMVGIMVEQVDTPLKEAFLKRHVWLQINLFTAFLAGFIVSIFNDTITQVVALAAFLPVLAGQSGNTGGQALAISLRGLTLGFFDKVPRRQLLIKEALLGAFNGLGVGIVAAIAMWLYARMGEKPAQEPMMLALVILLAMIGGCVSSGLSGVLIPVTLRRFGFDPATASSIFLTTVTDIVGMGLMLLLASALVL